MRIRHSCAINFYQEASDAVIEDFVKNFSVPSIPVAPVAALVPHAGWFYSGKTAARVFFTLREKNPGIESFVFFGAVHRMLLHQPALYPDGVWETPFGDLKINSQLAEKIINAKLGIISDPGAHEGEHSIEVSLPFIKYFFPGADFVPIACAPGPANVGIGSSLGKLVNSEKVAVIASSDLTHYGTRFGFQPSSPGKTAIEFVVENDMRIIDLAASLDAGAIESEARTHLNACGSGAIAATVAAAKSMGADKGLLVEHSTSNDANPETFASTIVGYCGMVFY